MQLNFKKMQQQNLEISPDFQGIQFPGRFAQKSAETVHLLKLDSAKYLGCENNLQHEYLAGLGYLASINNFIILKSIHYSLY